MRLTLDQLGHKYGTDKASPPPAHYHGYLTISEQYFEPIKNTVKNVLEIGVGYGASLRMWDQYFANASVGGMDIVGALRMKDHHENVRTGDQSNRDDLSRIAVAASGHQFDIIIDDGGHTMEQQQVSLGYLFKFLAPGGWYVVEDLFTSRSAGVKFNPSGTKWTTLKMKV